MSDVEPQDTETPEEEAIEAEEAPSEASALSNKLQNTEAELAETKDRLMRAIAEAENTRRRAERDKADASSYAITKFARDLLNVADNMRRAMESMPEDAKAEGSALKGLAEGVEMTERELLSVFERHGIEKIEPEGEKFSHDFHQAMFEVETDDKEPGTIMQVMQAGYVLKDRLLRPAMVGVSKAPKAAAPAGDGVDKTV